MQTSVVDWLLAGDPAIRWQVLRDLLDAQAAEYEIERFKITQEGWGNYILELQNTDGNWGYGIYNPKWISTTYTLLLLFQFGLPQDHQSAQRGCAQFFFRGLEKDGGINLFKNYNYSETCVNGMILTLLGYYHFPDPRIHSIAQFLLNQQMADGGWNCQAINGAIHSSFHTTISVLEGLAQYGTTYPETQPVIQPAIKKAHNFLLEHAIYKSHRTGRPAYPAVTRMCFPPRWRYDFIRALDYFQSINAPRDERMKAAIDLLISKQCQDGRWLLNQNWNGKVFFQLEEAGFPSRWNTLRALRIIKWWEKSE